MYQKMLLLTLLIHIMNPLPLYKLFKAFNTRYSYNDKEYRTVIYFILLNSYLKSHLNNQPNK